MHDAGVRGARQAGGVCEGGSDRPGVSPDPVEAVKRFHDGQELNFTLLADEDKQVVAAYGVWVEKSMYGRCEGSGTLAFAIVCLWEDLPVAQLRCTGRE